MIGRLHVLDRLAAVIALLVLVVGLTAGAAPPVAPRPRSTAEIPTTVPQLHGPTLPGTAVYPAQDIPLRFDHRRHLALGLACQRCHDKVDHSTSSAELNVPTGRACDGCHGPQHPRPAEAVARCTLCHARVEGDRVTAGLRMPKPLLRFNHKLHLRLSGGRCDGCHQGIESARLATVLHLPREATCLSCHDGAQATARCAACHPTEASGRLILRASADRAAPKLVPRAASAWTVEHDLAFVEDHAGPARARPGLCKSCHDESSCQECHNGVLRPLRIHAADYVTAHAVDARARTMDCQSCHRTQTFCLGCHERLGFGERQRGPFGVGGGLSFHPDGWSGPSGAQQGHAQAAQRNLSACASCHDEDSCLSCHATSAAPVPGLGVSPHGHGFAGSSKCDALAAANHRVCLRCHAPGDPHNECL